MSILKKLKSIFQKTSSLKFKMLLGFLSLNLALSILLGFVLFQVSNSIYYKSFLNHKKSLGLSLAKSIDGIKFQTFNNEKSLGDSEFKRYFELLKATARNENFITWIYTLSYDEKNDKLLYAIDATPSDNDTIWIENEFLGVRTFINRENTISINYDSIDYKEELEINFKNKKFHFVIDQNKKEIFINKEKILSIIESSPLVGETKFGKISKTNPSQIVELNYQNSSSKIEKIPYDLYFSEKSEDIPISIPGWEFIEADEMKARIKNAIKTCSFHLPNEPEQVAYGTFITLIAPIHFNENKCSGAVLLSISVIDVKIFKSKMTFTSVIATIVSFLITLVITYILSTFFTEPIAKFAIAVKEVSRGNFKTKLNIVSKDEFGELANSFNQMASTIEIQNQEIKDYSENLLNKITERTKDLEDTKKEIEDLNTFSHLINSLSDLNSIFTEISKYFYHTFGITAIWLLLPDEKREFLKAYKAYSYNKLPEDKYEYLMTKKIPLQENEGGITYKNFLRKKPFYLSKIPKFEFEIDREIIGKLSLASFFQVPLVRKEECVGIFSFTNFENEMKISKSDIRKISNLCSQIAGAIDTNHLLKQVEKARANADAARIEAEIERGISIIAKLEVEKAKKKTEDLNQLIKKVNETSDLEEIMKIILSYVKDNYHLPYYSLFTLDPKENVLKFANAIFPDYITSEHKKMISSNVLSVTEKNIDSVHSRALALKTPVFLPDAEAEIKTKMGRVIQGVLKHKSFLTLPIILQNNPIGTLDFFSLEPLRLREEEITELSLLAEQLAGVIQGAILLKQVQEEKEKAELAKQEIETLNEFTKLINSTSDISLIFKEIYSYLNRAFGFTNLWVLLVDKNKKELYSDMNTTVYKEGYDFDFDFFKTFQVTLDEKLGTLYQTYVTATPLYVPDISTGDIKTKTLINGFDGKTYSTSKMDFKIIIKGKLKSLLQIPLILQNEVIGIVCLSIFDEVLELSHYQIEKLVSFSNQIAGVIHNAQLLKQTEEAKGIANIEKEKALFAQKETERQKQETESLNNLIRSLNEDMNIKVIMRKIHGYINNNYNINYYGLAVVNKDRESLTTIETEMPDYVSEVDRIKINQLKTQIKEKVGAHAMAFKGKKPFFFPRVRKTGLTPEETFTIEKIKFESLLIIPLILQNEPIGFLDLYNVGKMELSKEDITKLSILGEQLAGIIHGSNLFKQVQEEKEKANAAREEAEKARKETESLNKLMKNINSVSSLIDIMTFIMYYLEKQLQFREFSLLLNDASKEELSVFSYTSPRASKEQTNYFKNWKKNYSDLSGLFSDVRENRKIVFSRKEEIRDADNNAKEWIEKGDFEYILLTPLVVYDELIAVLFLHAKEADNPITKEKLIKVEKFSDLVAGSIFNAKLLERVEEARGIAEIERSKSEKLLLNILPKDVAAELKEKGFAEPVLFENVSVMFTDFKGFTTIAEKLTPQELIKDLDACFVQFDKISERFNLEKLKTIGDSYMCAGGIPKRNKTHAIDCCLAALEIQSFMNMMKKLKEGMGFPYWELRLGIHTGPLIAGVIGERKFAYDVWGDTVNTASRMESSGTPGRINISYSTYEAVKDYFECEYRGEVSAKNKGVVKMYYLDRIKREFSKDEEGLMPNGKFWEMYG